MATARAPDDTMKRLVVILTAVGLLAVFVFFGWVFYATGGFAWTGGSKAIVVALVAGAIGVGALTGVLMWLAFYSDRKGYDDPPTFDEPDQGG
jgi:cation transporter-like permease